MMSPALAAVLLLPIYILSDIVSEKVFFLAVQLALFAISLKPVYGGSVGLFGAN